MAQIVLDRIDKIYAGGVKAVDGLSLEIRDGEFMVLVGPSGCGKSTALRSIAGLEEISVGHDRHRRPGGQRPAAQGPRHRHGVPELRALPAHDRRAEPGVRPAACARRPRTRSSAGSTEVAKMLGLEQYLKRKPAALSGGQRQRVAMGRAIVREPQAFLMDEPLSNLDAKLRVSHAGVAEPAARTARRDHGLRDARPGGGHDPRAPGLRAAGRQAAAGRHPAALFNSPVNLFVAGFIGSPAMNFVDAPSWSATTGPRSPSPATGCRCRPTWSAAKPGLDRLLRPGGHPRHPALGLRGRRPGRRQLAADAGHAPSVTEELGSEIHVIFTIDAPPVEHASITEAAPGDEGEDEARSRWRAASRCGPRGSRPAARSARASPSSWPWTPRTCTSSTRSAACPSATRKRAPRPPYDDRTRGRSTEPHD